MYNFNHYAGKILGDIHDFFKLNFLEFMSRGLKEKIGLNWYLVKQS